MTKEERVQTLLINTLNVSLNIPSFVPKFRKYIVLFDY